MQTRLPQAAAVARFWEKVEKTPDSCWLWTGTKDRNGYGLAMKTVAHRVAYAIEVGPIPAGLTLDHMCRNRACVRPSHLRPCTMRENVLAPHSRSLSALNAAKTHCSAGHPFSRANTRVNSKGHRSCARCASRHAAKSRAQRVPRPRQPRPRTRGNARLNPVAVSVIRLLLSRGVTGRRIARAYGVTDAAISRLKNGSRWSLNGVSQ